MTNEEDYQKAGTGLDVSLKSVSICVIDDTGHILWRDETANDSSEVAQARKMAVILHRMLVDNTAFRLA